MDYVPGTRIDAEDWGMIHSDVGSLDWRSLHSSPGDRHNLILGINKHTFTTVMTVAVKGNKKVTQSTLCICGLHIPRLSQVGIKQFLKEKKIPEVSKKQNLDMLCCQPLFT